MNLVKQLQQVAGDLATAFATLSSQCVAQRAASEREAAIATFLQLVPGRSAAEALLQAHGATCWPGSFGESPYEHSAGVLRHALSGFALPPRSTNAEREMHLAFLKAYALPTAVARWELDRDALWGRYPRLLRAMQHGALLTPREAEGAVYILLHTNPTARQRSCASSEAVSHFGGNVAAVRAARRWRARFASTARLALAA